MISTQVALVKREVWEHRSIWITPATVAFVMQFLVIAIVIMIAAFGEQVNPEIERLADATLPEPAREAALAVALLVLTIVFPTAMWFLMIFYCLDALYAERKDRSILFWRSLPITDAETVTSKLLTVALAIPVATMAAIMVSHLLNLIVISVWLGIEGVNPFRFIWAAVPLFDTWAAIFIFLLAVPIWISPLLGWFLFISAWAKRGPFLRAVLPVAVLPVFEFIIFRSWNLGLAILERLSLNAIPIFDVANIEAQFDEDRLNDTLAQGVNVTSVLDVGKFVTSIEVWVGLIVCGLFATAAIYMRRYKDDS